MKTDDSTILPPVWKKKRPMFSLPSRIWPNIFIFRLPVVCLGFSDASRSTISTFTSSLKCYVFRFEAIRSSAMMARSNKSVLCYALCLGAKCCLKFAKQVAWKLFLWSFCVIRTYKYHKYNPPISMFYYSEAGDRLIFIMRILMVRWQLYIENS